MYCRRLQSGLLGLIAILILTPGVSRAKDYCLTVNSSTFVLVGQGFAIPPKGKCKPWTGFTAQIGLNSPSVGTGCTSLDGSHLNFTITTSFPEFFGATVADSITLALPSQSGTTFETQTGVGTSQLGVVGASCSKSMVPANAIGDQYLTGPGAGMR